MKTINNRKWQSWILAICFFISASFSVKAQSTFSFDQATAQSLTGGDYVSSINAVTFFSKNNLCFYPLDHQAGQTIDWYVFDKIPEATAALSWEEDLLLIFNGNYYIQYQVSTGELISEWIIWEGLPSAWFNKLDGAVRWDDNTVFFFYGSSYVMYDLNAQTYSEIGSLNDWNGWPESWADGLDAVVNLGDGFIYFLNQGQMISYNTSQQSLSKVSAFGSNAYAAAPAVGNQNHANNNSPKLPLNTGNQNQIANNKNATPPSQARNQNNIDQSIPEEVEEENTSNCLIGQSGEAVNKSRIFGTKKGRVYSDNLPQGSSVVQVNIYSAKAWGNNVIGGIQTVVKDASGALKKQTVIGKRTTNMETIVIEKGDCITGITGSTGPGNDGYLNSISIHTSNGASNSVGISKGKSFKHHFQNGQFEGFQASFLVNITGIGVLHTGGGTTGNAVSVSNSNGGGNSNSDLYTADYFDYTENLADATEWIAQPLPGLDWLGAGIDILRYDPLEPTDRASRKTFRSILVTNSGERAGNAGQNLKPYGSNFSSFNSGSERDSSSWIQSYKQFSNSFNIAAEGSVEVPGVASSSLSGSHSEMNSTSVGSETIYMFNTVKRDIHEVSLRLFWKEEVTTKFEDGTAAREIKKYRQKLDPNFVDDVANLPVVTGTVPDLKITKRNQVLPSNLNLVRAKYLAFINKYGTHFAHKVVWGGKYVARTQVKRSDYEKSRMTETNFKNSASVTIKKVKVGRTVSFGMGESQGNSNSKTNFKREVFASGGNGETDLDKWRDKVDKTMAPVDMTFLAMCDALIEELFPNDPDIETKKQTLKIITEQYIWDNYRPLKPSRYDFFRPLPEPEMPTNISITNGGGYVMWFTVKYKHNGGFQTKESPNFTLGFSKSIEVPAGATDVTITAAQTTGEIFEKKLDKPETKCYKCWGTIFSTGWGECDE